MRRRERRDARRCRPEPPAAAVRSRSPAPRGAAASPDRRWCSWSRPPRTVVLSPKIRTRPARAFFSARAFLERHAPVIGPPCWLPAVAGRDKVSGMDRLTLLRVSRVGIVAGVVAAAAAAPAQAAAPTPSGTHPRLFLTQDVLTALTAKARDSSSAAAQMVAYCQTTIDHPEYNTDRGGSDGDTWPGSAVDCAFAYLTTQERRNTSPRPSSTGRRRSNDDQTLGDSLGCVAGVSTDWQTWDGNAAARPPMIITVTHDTGYPMRWYGPDIALTYDWLYSAPGVDGALLAQTRTCLTAWIDYYTPDAATTTTRPARTTTPATSSARRSPRSPSAPTAGRTATSGPRPSTTLFGKLLVGEGLAGDRRPAWARRRAPWWAATGARAGSTARSACSSTRWRRARSRSTASPLPEMDAWTNSLTVRYVYGTRPHDRRAVGGRRLRLAELYQSPAANQLDAVLAGPSSDQAAAWAASMKQTQTPGGGDASSTTRSAELRAVTPAGLPHADPGAVALVPGARDARDVRAHGLGRQRLLGRVQLGAPGGSDDHEHFAASNFVFSRGADHLIVDPLALRQAEHASQTNAVTADSARSRATTPPARPPGARPSCSGRAARRRASSRRAATSPRRSSSPTRRATSPTRTASG